MLNPIRSILITTIAGATLFGQAFAPAPVCARPSNALVIKKIFVRPTRISSSGDRTVRLSVRVSKRNTTIVSVSAYATAGAQGGPLVPLAAEGGSVYSGTVSVPVNFGTRSVTGAVYIQVVTSQRTEPLRKLTSLTVLPTDDSLPPPPPPND